MAETQRDIAEYQSDHDLLTRIDERTLNLVQTVEKLTAAISNKTDDHEARIRKNELTIESMKTSSTVWRYALSVAITIVGLASTIISIFVSRS
jgi:hypothetical protein